MFLPESNTHEDETLREQTSLSPTQITHLLELCLGLPILQVSGNVLPTKRWGSHGIPCVPSSGKPLHGNDPKNCWTSTMYLEMLCGRYVLCDEEDWRWRFPEHLNSTHPTIMFTMEQEDGNLLFLDSLLHRKDDRTLEVSVYRKPSHTDWYLHFSSHHPPPREERHGLLPLPPSPDYRQNENVTKEEGHLRMVLEGNDYPETFVNATSRPRTATEPTEEPLATAFIPYVAGLSEDMRRVCWRYKIRTIFCSTSSLHGQLMQVKDQDPLGKKSNGVYQVSRSNGCVYIGETKRALEVHIKEHQTATRRGELEKSAIAEHAWTTITKYCGMTSKFWTRQHTTAHCSWKKQFTSVSQPQTACWTETRVSPSLNAGQQSWDMPTLHQTQPTIDDIIQFWMPLSWSWSGDCASLCLVFKFCFFCSFVLCALMKTTV